MSIDFRLSPDQIALRDGARAFANAVLKDVRTTIRNYAKPDERFYDRPLRHVLKLVVLRR